MRRWPILVGCCAAAIACNALNGSGDLAIDDSAACTTCDVDGGTPPSVPPETPPGTPPATPPGTPPTTPPGTPPPVSPPGTPPPPPPSDGGKKPTYCSGIVFYARYDKTLDSAAGQTPNPASTVTFSPGKFGMGASFVNNATAFYATGAGLTYPLAEGTTAMWVTPQFASGNTSTRTFFKVTIDTSTAAANSAGPEIGYSGAAKIVFVQNHNGGGATATGISAPATGMDYNAANLVVGTWRQTPSLLGVSLNGAAPTTTTTAWSPNGAANFVRTGSAVQSPDSTLDDVAMWNRILADAEIQAVYTATAAIGDVCGM